MSGILLLLILIIWLFMVLKTATWLTQRIPNAIVRGCVFILIFALLNASLIADELIGKQQFERLCKTGGIKTVDLRLFKGQKVEMKLGQETSISGFILPTKSRERLFYEPGSSRKLFSYVEYYSGGGWLMRYTPISMGASYHPMLFDSSCPDSPPYHKVLDSQNITRTN